MRHVNEQLVRTKLDDWAREAARLGLQAEARRSGPHGRRAVVMDALRGWVRVATR